MQHLDRFKLPPNFRGRSAIIVQLWMIVQALLFKPSPQIFYGWRRCLLRLFGAQIGKNVLIRSSVTVTYPWKLSIGDYSWVGDDVVLYSVGEIIIGSNVVISQSSYICAALHDYTKPDFPAYTKKVTIEDECWLATDVYVAPGIIIGNGTVVGARSSVFKNLPGGKICFGNPARVVKERLG